jgi:hypothetical protein
MVGEVLAAVVNAECRVKSDGCRGVDSGGVFAGCSVKGEGWQRVVSGGEVCVLGEG